MRSEWIARELSDCVTLVSGGTPSKSDNTYWNGHLPWISAKDLKSFRIADSEDHLTKAGVERVARIVPPETVLLLVRGMTLHNNIPICITTKDSAFNQDVKALLPRDGLENCYLPYLLLGNKDLLQSYVDSAGHGTGRINTDTLNRMPFLLPPKRCQRAISQVLGALDQKIDLLRQMNETLEAMARALFKSWFVDFDPVRKKADGLPTGLPKEIEDLFPSEVEDSELGEIPKGWMVGTVSDSASLISMGIAPAYIEDGGVVVLNQKCVRNHEVDFSKARRHDDSAKKIGEKEVQVHDVLINSTGEGTLGRVAQVQSLRERTTVDAHVMIVRPKSESLVYYLGGNLTRREVEIESMAEGSTGQTGLSRVRVGLLPLVIPNENVLCSFNELVGTMMMERDSNRSLNHTLSELRDSLLPKLISGDYSGPHCQHMNLALSKLA